MAISTFGGAPVPGTGRTIDVTVEGVLVDTEVVYSAFDWGAGNATELIASTPVDYLLTSFDMACGEIDTTSSAVILTVLAGVGDATGSWWEDVVLVASCCMSVNAMTGGATARIGRDLTIPVFIPAGTRLAMSVSGGLGDHPTGWLLYVRLTPVRA